MTKLCVSLTESTTEAMLNAMRGLPEYVDMVEFRLDYLQDPDVSGLCRNKNRPIIVTCRPEREGGHFSGSERDRISALRQAADAGADFVDIELDSVSELGPLAGQARKIVSYHNFTETPANLENVYSRIVEADPDVAKIAVKANDIVDTIRIFDLLNTHRLDLPLIGLSMGEEGIATRVLAGKFGGFLSFACLDEERSAAEGQVSYREMEELYRFSQIDADTGVYGVAADPVAHSMSPAIHNAAFAELDLNAVYLPLRVKQTRPFLDGYERLGLRGLSVTIPHKQSMVGLMDEVDELTERIAEGAKVAYGPEQVAEAADYGAVEHLLVLDETLRAERAGEGDWSVDADDIIETVEQKGGEVTVFSSEFDPGQQLANLGGIAALLRYRLE